MNKKIAGFLQGKGLEVSKNTAYGKIEGFEVSCGFNPYSNPPFFMQISFYATEETKRALYERLNALQFKHATFTLNSYGLLFTIGAITIKKLCESVEKIILDVTQFLKKVKALGYGYCPMNGEEFSENAKKISMNGIEITLNPDSIEQVNQAIAKENQAFEEIPNNYGKGILGALIGAAAGVIIYIILFFIGYISAISGLISIVAGAFLYQKFGGKQNKEMIAIVSIISVVSMIFSVFILYFIAANGLVEDYGFSSIGMKAFIDMMSVSEFKSEFIMNLVITLLFTFLGVGYQIFYMFKSIKKPKKIS